MKKLLFAMFFMTLSLTFAGNEKPHLEIQETFISISLDDIKTQNNLDETIVLSTSCYFECRSCIIVEGVRYCTEWKCCGAEETIE